MAPKRSRSVAAAEARGAAGTLDGNTNSSLAERRLTSRRCVANRYIDVPSLEQIGLYDDVVEILQSCGWMGLLGMRDATYPALVREFLSDFEFVDAEDVDGDDKEPFFRFVVRGRTIEMALSTVRELFGWPAVENGLPRPSPQDMTEAWKEITGTQVEFDPSRSIESGIRNELYCYLHRVISCSIYGRANGQEKVTQADHDLLLYFHRRIPVDFARLLGLRLADVRASGGPLVCGGFITRIVRGIAGFSVRRHYPERLKAKLIDVGMLKRMRVIHVDKVTGNVTWVHFKEPPPSLQDSERQDQLVKELHELRTEQHQMALNMHDYFQAMNPGWQPSSIPSHDMGTAPVGGQCDQLEKELGELKTEQHKLALNMYEYFQAKTPGWKLRFPLSPPA